MSQIFSAMSKQGTPFTIQNPSPMPLSPVVMSCDLDRQSFLLVISITTHLSLPFGRPTTETNEDSGYNHAPIQAVSAWPSGEGWMPYGPSGYYDAPKLPCISRQSQSNSVSQSGDDNNILPRLLRQHLSLRRKSGIFWSVVKLVTLFPIYSARRSIAAWLIDSLLVVLRW